MGNGNIDLFGKGITSVSFYLGFGQDYYLLNVWAYFVNYHKSIWRFTEEYYLDQVGPQSFTNLLGMQHHHFFYLLHPP